jgi:two-component sensor histidine kinase
VAGAAEGQGNSDLLVVGVGASAGGEEALEHLFGTMPNPIGAAFVVVTALGPNRETRLSEIIGRHTRMPVVNVAHGMTVEREHIYVLPSNAGLTMKGMQFELRPIDADHRERNPIDVFFTSLAREVQENSVGIVLSGGGSDGTLGIKGIKEEGGLTIAQGHDGTGPHHEVMTGSAIASGLVDMVVPVEDIGKRLQEYARTFGMQRSDGERRRIGEQTIVTALTSLEQELKETRGRLQATIEERETALVAAEERQRLLIAELNHRVRNMLQVVIGLGSQTLHRSRDLAQFEKAFMGRMQALARAYELLSRDGWHDVPLTELLRIQLSPFATERARHSIQGPPVLLKANAALALGLALYELATNATKYGALSETSGHVSVSWTMERPVGGSAQFVLKWLESGGPAVSVPTYQGFGSELVQRQLRYELNGQAVMDFSPAGLEVTFTIPARGAVLLVEGAAQDEAKPG